MYPYHPKQRTIEDLAKDQIFIYENWEVLCKSHPRQVIAVCDRTIIGIGGSFGHLSNWLKKDGYKPAEIAMAYIDPNPEFLKFFLAQRQEKIEALRKGDVSP